MPCRSAAVAVLLLVSSSALAQRAGVVSFQRLAIPEDVPAHLCSAIAQDARGFLWFGTQRGLVRYDGYEYRVFRSNPADAKSLAGNYVRALLASRDGRLWVGTFSGGLSVFDPRTETFERVPLAYDASKGWPRIAMGGSGSRRRRDSIGSILARGASSISRGHAAGDAVLVELARLLQRTFRASDHVVRWGGEEFLIVARFVDGSLSSDLAEKLRAAVASHEFVLPDGTVLRRTCSIGVAVWPFTPAVSWERAVDLADAALYEAKRGGRNKWRAA